MNTKQTPRKRNRRKTKSGETSSDSLREIKKPKGNPFNCLTHFESNQSSDIEIMGSDGLDKKMDLILAELAQIKLNTTDIKADLAEVKDSLEYTQADVLEAQKDIKSNADNIKSVDEKTENLKHEIETLKNTIAHQNEDLKKLDIYSRRFNVIIEGVKESPYRNTETLVRDILKEKCHINSIEIDKCHRIGYVKKDHSTISRPRKIIVRFRSHRDRDTVIENRKHLKGTGLIISEDYGPELNKDEAELRPILRLAKKSDSNAFLKQGTLTYKGHKFKPSQINAMNLNLKEIHEEYTAHAILFNGKYSPLSTMHKSDFFDATYNLTFESAEQCFQYHKCIEKKNETLANKILQSRDGYEARFIGKGIETDMKWNQTKGVELMERVMKFKFAKEPMISELRRTNNLILAEASYDKVWGIGIPLRSPEAKNMDNWTGQNLLGKILTQIRNDL